MIELARLTRDALRTVRHGSLPSICRQNDLKTRTGWGKRNAPVSEHGAGVTPLGYPAGTVPVARWAVLADVRPQCARHSHAGALGHVAGTARLTQGVAELADPARHLGGYSGRGHHGHAH